MSVQIVKVQLSLASSDGVQRALVYNRKRDHQGEFPAPPDLVKKMNGRPKAFFAAAFRKNKGGDGYTILIGDEAPWQDW